MRYKLLYAYCLLITCRQQIIIGTSNSYIHKKEVITNPERSDGFGAQFQTIIVAVIYAELNNIPYVYSPFAKMEHNYNNENDFIEKKEWLINFITHFEIINENHIIKPISCNEYISFFEKNLSKCINSRALIKIKELFRSNKNIDDYFNKEDFNIAIHMRRPNIHDSRISGTDTPDSIFLNIINKLRKIYASKNPVFHLYSQGNIAKFKIFDAQDIILHLNESIENTFISMVFADILVAGASSFSYTAAILSDGVIYYIPFWHRPLPHWISIDFLG